VGEGAFLPGNILSMAAPAADRLIAAGSGDAALLYLWLLRQGGEYSPARAQRALKWDGARCAGAHALLVGMGLCDGRTEPERPVVQELLPPEYSAADINKELENKDSPFPVLVSEVQRRLGKALSTADLKTLYTIYDFSGLPVEVILMAVSWCEEEVQRKYGPGRKPRLPQIQREAQRWKEQGVDTLEAAEAHVKRLAALRSRTGRIMAVLDIRDRPAVAREQEYIEQWVDMGFPDEVIRLAYERTVLKKQSMSWPYMNSILRSWHQKGLHSVEQIEKNDGQRRAPRARPGAGATAPQPGTPGQADRRAREQMERLRELLRKQNGEGT